MSKYYDLKNLMTKASKTYKVVIKERGFARKAELNRKYGKEVEKDVD